MTELVYIGFANTSDDSMTHPGCQLARFSTVDGRRWRRDNLTFKEIAYPQEWMRTNFGSRDFSYGQRTLNAIGQDGVIVFNGYVNKEYGIIFVYPDRAHRFFPVNEPKDTFLVAMDFSDDARTLVLQYQTRTLDDEGKRDVFLTQFIRWDKRSGITVDTVPGWFAYASPRFAILVDKSGKPFAQDLIARQRGQDWSAEAKIAALLTERNSPRVYPPGTDRARGKILPTAIYAPGKMFTFSPDRRLMFELENEEIGPPGGGAPSPDWSNDFVRDNIFASGKGILWTIERGSHAPLDGIQFTDKEGTFRFLSPGPLKMGRTAKKMIPYPPGIFTVNLRRNTVRHVPAPNILAGALQANVLLNDAIMRYKAGYTLFLMKRSV